MLDVENRANVRSPVTGEALVRPAKGVRREDHVVELENGVVEVRRFLFEHVEPGARDPALLKRVGQRLLIDDRSSGRIYEIGRRLHQGETLGVDEVAGFRGQRTTYADEIRMAEYILKANELHAKLGGELRVGIRIVRNQLHVEGLDQPEELGPDISDSDRSEGASDETDTHIVASFGKTGRSFTSQPILHHELAAQRQNEGDDRNRDRPAHPIGSDGERDACPRAGVHIDGVVPDAESGNDSEPPVGVDALSREAVRERISASKSAS